MQKMMPTIFLAAFYGACQHPPNRFNASSRIEQVKWNDVSAKCIKCLAIDTEVPVIACRYSTPNLLVGVWGLDKLDGTETSTGGEGDAVHNVGFRFKTKFGIQVIELRSAEVMGEPSFRYRIRNLPDCIDPVCTTTTTTVGRCADR